MKPAAPDSSGATADARQRGWALLLCVAAAVRVFIYSAGFPMFSNIDEPRHFDLVVKYSHGEVPRSLNDVCPEAARDIAIFGSPEYLKSPKDFPDGKIPPPRWSQSSAEVQRNLKERFIGWEHYRNSETEQPPLYYVLAGGWLDVGKGCHVGADSLLYWIRFLNLLFAGGMVWTGYVAARLAFPDQSALQLGVAALLAFIPQDAFYSIENDALSPVCFGLVLICLLRLWSVEVPDKKLGAITGLALAATYLAKLTNLPLLAVAAAVVVFKVISLVRARKLRPALPGLAWLGLCAGLPVAGWTFWCLANYGDLTGSADKMKLLTWTRKPFSLWWHHPIFTAGGCWTFVSQTLASFWRGEFTWYNQRLASPLADAIYIFSSLLFCAGALLGVLPRSRASAPQRRAIWISLACFAATVLFFAWLSISLDFGDCYYPSQEYPYFTSGRLLTGALVPFAVVYVYGLERALRWTKRRWPFVLALVCLCLLMTVSEIIVNRPAFSSAYNWFHL